MPGEFVVGTTGEERRMRDYIKKHPNMGGAQVTEGKQVVDKARGGKEEITTRAFSRQVGQVSAADLGWKPR